MTFLIELVQSVKESALMKELRVERMFPLSLVCVKFTSHVSSSLLSVREGEKGEERRGQDVSCERGGGKTPVEGGGDSLVFIIHFPPVPKQSGKRRGMIRLFHRDIQRRLKQRGV